MREAPGCFSYFAADFLKLARIFLDQGNFSWTLKTGTMTDLLFFKTSFEDGFKVNWLAWKQVSSSKSLVWCSNATILLHFIQHFKIFCTDFHNLWFPSVAYLLGCFHTILYIVNRYSVYMYIFHCEVGHLPQEEPLCIHCQYVVLHVIRKKNKISLIGLGGGSLALLFLIYI